MKQKNIIIGVVTVIIIIGLVTVLVSNKKQTPNVPANPETEEIDVIPTVDSSVKVELQGKNNNKAVELTVNSIPKGTSTIEYSMSYQTKQQGLQGIIGTMEIKEGEKEHTISRDLGTCSSGTCVYHDVDGKIKLEMKFTGEYGEKIFSNEYDL